jgi:two-component system sensor histidine kinase BaeS
VERFQPQATSQQVKISIINPAPSLPVISVDHLRIEQILTNLLSNALRYTSENGKVELTFDTTPTTILLRVHDTGPGIPTESLPYIFGRFYRVEKSRSRTEGGSGLGLAIARQLARAHGGDLTVANHPSGGAVFTLILPL